MFGYVSISVSENASLFVSMSVCSYVLAIVKTCFVALKMKSAFDLMLDTWSKNGHTTGQDPIWAGVPAVTMHGDSASRRSSLSIAAALGRADGVTFSLKVGGPACSASHVLRRG